MLFTILYVFAQENCSNLALIGNRQTYRSRPDDQIKLFGVFKTRIMPFWRPYSHDSVHRAEAKPNDGLGKQLFNLKQLEVVGLVI